MSPMLPGNRTLRYFSISWAGMALACAPVNKPDSQADQLAEQVIDADSLMAHIKILSQDSYEGRGPGTPGEDSTVNYLTGVFKSLGLAPGNPDGSWLQPVELVSYTSRPNGSFTGNGAKVSLEFPANFVAVTHEVGPQVSLRNSEAVFVGYGVDAPEYQWNDFKGMDLTGKTLIMLVNDPAVPDPADSTRLDPDTFRGDAMTYYGRWTYKYEVAAAQKAAAVIIIHDEGPAGYGFETVRNSWGRENMDIDTGSGGSSHVPVEGWITLDKARELFQAAGRNFDSLHRAATTRDFTPVALGLDFNVTIEVKRQKAQSRNVIARLEGSDSALKNEYVVYTSHWDHLGRDANLEGDQVFNGALDNASGLAGMLEIARAFKNLSAAPKRSVLFIAVTAEESGLLGTQYYATHPLYPLEKTVANINIDEINPWGRTRDVVVIGKGNTTLEDMLDTIAQARGRTLTPDPEPGKGFYYRSDHFEFAKRGVPAIFLAPGTIFLDLSPDTAAARRTEYDERFYHQVGDEIQPYWDLSGGVDDVKMLFRLGLRVANGLAWPEWKPGTEFKAIREKQLSGN